MRSLNLALTWYLTTLWCLIFIVTLSFQLSELKFTPLNLSPKYQLYTALPPSQSRFTDNDIDQSVSWGVEDSRLLLLTRFLISQKSDLVNYAPQIVTAADTYQIDYKLLAALAVFEEDKALKKYNNPFAYRSLDKKYLNYSSVEQSLDEFPKLLKTEFLDKGLKTPEEIQPTYTSPASYKSGWSDKINALMKQLK